MVNIDSVLKDTVDEFCGAVCSTLGPGGKTVIIADDQPHVTKDGVTVSENIYYSDPAKNAIVSLIKEAARKTAHSVGDGTTTSTLLVKSFIDYGSLALQTCKSQKDFFDAFDEAISDVIEYLEDSKISIDKDSSILSSVISISSNGDQEVIDLVNKAVKAAGADGVINVETSDNLVSTVESTNGASLDTKVYTNGKFEKGVTSIILIEGPVADVHQIEPILRVASQTKQPHIIIAKEFGQDVQRVININNTRNSLDVTLVEAEGFSLYRLELLRDIAAVTGATILSVDGSTSVNLRDYSSAHNGTVEKALISPNELILFPFEDKYNEETDKLVNKLKAEYNQVKLDENSAPASHLKRRLAKYSSIATISVGGATQAEVKEKKDRVDDAVCAVSAAVNGGVLPGGGMALFYAGRFLHSKSRKMMKADEQAAINVVIDTCLTPISFLCVNAGVDWENEVKNPAFNASENTVLDLNTMKVGDAFELGIIDPALVAINAIVNASSVAKTLLKSKVIIIPEDNG